MMSKDPNFQPFLEKYKQLLKKAGSEVVLNSAISEQTTIDLEKPLLPANNFVDLFFNRVNQMCDERLLKFSKN